MDLPMYSWHGPQLTTTFSMTDAASGLEVIRAIAAARGWAGLAGGPCRPTMPGSASPGYPLAGRLPAASVERACGLTAQTEVRGRNPCGFVRRLTGRNTRRSCRFFRPVLLCNRGLRA